ncbi:PAS domain-containing protein [Conexibacter woesei]|uniref:sensor histidine kinase n=1 Tax=Conexibacter woesei TaxID=191495 RepID=UPI0004182FAC|nr:PAS domain-containing protein [Conexibacter woesei]
MNNNALGFGSGGDPVLAALVESIADAVYAVDHEGRVQFANGAAVRMLGYDDEAQLLGQPSHATIHHHKPDGTPFPEDACPLLRPRVTGEVVRVEEDWFVRRDGTFVPVAYSSAPVDTPEGRGAVVVFQDITERRAAAAARLRERATHASRARIVEAALDERRRLGRDLHDGAQQRLTNIALAAQIARRSEDPAEVGEMLGAVVEETQAAIDELRALGAGLHPAVLTHRGLLGAVESLTARTPVPVALDVTRERFPDLVEATAYFVIAEALANVAKHAGAEHTRVEVAREGELLRILVEDDGRGGADPSGSGLSGLADRVAAVDGALTVAAGVDGRGTRVEATLPARGPDLAG